MKPNALETYAKVIADISADAQNLVLFSDVEHFNSRNEITSFSFKAADGFYVSTLKLNPHPITRLSFTDGTAEM